MSKSGLLGAIAGAVLGGPVGAMIGGSVGKALGNAVKTAVTGSQTKALHAMNSVSMGSDMIGNLAMNPVRNTLMNLVPGLGLAL